MMFKLLFFLNSRLTWVLQSFYSAFVFNIQISVWILPGLLWQIIGRTEKEPKDWQRVTNWAPLRNSISLKPTHITRWVHWTVSVSGKSISVIQLLCSAVTNVFPRAANTICDDLFRLTLQRLGWNKQRLMSPLLWCNGSSLIYDQFRSMSSVRHTGDPRIDLWKKKSYAHVESTHLLSAAWPWRAEERRGLNAPRHLNGSILASLSNIMMKERG